MKKPFLVALSVAIATMVTGCVTSEYNKTNAKALDVQKIIERNNNSMYFSKVESLQRPPVDTRPIKIETTYPWLNDKVSVKLGSVPLSTALDRIFIDQPDIRVLYGSDVKPNKRVSINASGTREEVLNQLSLAADYGFVPNKDRVKVMRYIEKTFEVRLPTGQYSGQLGSQGKQSQNKESSRVEGQYINVEYSKIDAFKDIADGVKNILKANKPNKTTAKSNSQSDNYIDPTLINASSQDSSDEMVGQVTSIPSMGSISVVTTPLLMESVTAYMNKFEEKLSKQVRLEAQILFFTSDEGKERGIDWNISKVLDNGNILKFYIPGTNILSPSSGYGLAFTGTGSWSGTQAFVRWLDKQGSVSAIVPVTQLALNTQPVRISQVLNVPYIDTISSDASQEIISADVKRDEKVEGIDIMITPHIEDDTVWLRAAGKYSQIVKSDKRIIADTELDLLTTQEAEINFTGKVKFNQSIIIGSTSQRINTTDKTSSYSLDFLGGNTAQEKVIQTLIVLTPRRAS